jgi:hypothetical protein
MFRSPLIICLTSGYVHVCGCQLSDITPGWANPLMQGRSSCNNSSQKTSITKNSACISLFIATDHF